YAFAARDGKVAGVQGATGVPFSRLGWVDRAVHARRDVVWLNSQLRGFGLPAEGPQYQTEFWNPTVAAWAQDPALNLQGLMPTLAALPLYNLTVDPRTGAVTGLAATPPVVQQMN